MKKRCSYFIVVASTIDGVISENDFSLPDWTSKEDKRHLKKMEEKADLLLFSRKTYELAKEFLKGKKCLVFTSKVEKIVEENDFLTWINPKKANLEEYVKSKGYKRICVLGGRGVYNFVMENDLVNEIYLTIEPFVFGNGIRIFSKFFGKKQFKLILVKKINKKGTILLRYKKQL